MLAGFPVSVTVNGRPRTEYPNVVVRFTTSGILVCDGLASTVGVAGTGAPAAVGAARGSGDGVGDIGRGAGPLARSVTASAS